MVDTQTVCCMCGDVGFSDKLFRCNKCRHRFQHSQLFQEICGLNRHRITSRSEYSATKSSSSTTVKLRTPRRERVQHLHHEQLRAGTSFSRM
ncbi:hypothetical protein CFP56_003347 [Quercus suber]|uniref:PHD-type zinc finger plants domain-containing protein n=1 Tax=Quercus suber TaxID=58331 RepID=A0AAW0IJD2_QUESU